ncbi:flagellar hook-basal body complex protein [Aliarcobacter butzleri]|uniref:flagellar hook-basal body complex protein n=1 Tax=Aliarcobacter butzleri TaxID=28197 RepID=UPI0021B575DA|nr:flagellar hook-basal body complex protein [Aliarcobacter butzleri]MCT7588843.1 flagellar hook-basal body complex protein [Aliarcobacter butzleri]
MIGALWTGVSGLASQTTAIDNESNNVANVNTVGYKASRISFADQIYQNQIGKGSYVQEAEKLFTQGSTKVTGVSYDIALKGDGFFTVINKNTLGTAETFYTRAGNLRMGTSGTLQTADGYEVQGWAMSSIDEKNDVISTNSNATRFTSDFTKTVGSAIIKHNDYIETIAAKTTNYDETAASDSTAVFSGAGQKTKSSKLKDIALATDNYNSLLTKYQDDPDAPSKGSIPQVSQVNFKTGLPPTSVIGKEGDSIEVTINGNTYTQKFIVTKSTENYREDIWNSLTPDERTLHGLIDPSTISTLPNSDQEIAIAAYDKVAGKIETYKAITDQISNSGSGGLVAYLAKNTSNPTADVLDPNGTYEMSTEISDMLQGVIQIESLIPGTEFKITSVSETLGGTKTTVKGTYQSTASAVEGSGKQALEDARDALSRLVTGNQQSVYTTQDLYGSAGIPTLDRSYTFSIDIFDKDLGEVIPVPNDGNTPPSAVPITIPAGATVDQIAAAINNTTTTTGVQLGDYITAKNINGYLVLETNDKNYDVEFDAKLQVSPTINLNNLVDNASYNYTIKVNGQTISVPITVGNELDSSTMNSIYNDISTAIDAYNLSNPTHTIEVGALTNGTFILTSSDSLDANLTVTSPGVVPTFSEALTASGTSTTLSEDTVALTTTPDYSTTYTINVAGKTFTYTTPADTSGGTIPYSSPTLTEIRNSLLAQINSDSDLSDLVTAASTGTDSIKFVQKALQNPSAPSDLGISAVGGTVTNDVAFVAGTASVVTITPNLTGTSKSELTFSLAGVPTIKIETEDEDTVANVYSKLMTELNKYGSTVTDRYDITQSGGDIVITEKAGTTGFSQAVTTSSVDLSAEIVDYPSWKLDASLVEVNPDYSGRKGAGAEFMEITTRIDQTTTQSSLQLRLDKLGISDSQFGSFSVDETGLVTITEGGVEYAVGQVSIARFTNNQGLLAVGDNNFQATQESGKAIYSINNNNTSGMQGQTLELSEADLSESLVNLMVFQRAFEANAKSITTADEMLTTLINLKR